MHAAIQEIFAPDITNLARVPLRCTKLSGQETLVSYHDIIHITYFMTLLTKKNIVPCDASRKLTSVYSCTVAWAVFPSSSFSPGGGWLPMSALIRFFSFFLNQLLPTLAFNATFWYKAVLHLRCLQTLYCRSMASQKRGGSRFCCISLFTSFVCLFVPAHDFLVSFERALCFSSHRVFLSFPFSSGRGHGFYDILRFVPSVI